MKNAEYNAELISSRAICSVDYLSLFETCFRPLILFYLWRIFRMFCCFQFLFPETQERNCYVMGIIKNS